jgi:hypothetical protein
LGYITQIFAVPGREIERQLILGEFRRDSGCGLGEGVLDIKTAMAHPQGSVRLSSAVVEIAVSAKTDMRSQRGVLRRASGQPWLISEEVLNHHRQVVEIAVSAKTDMRSQRGVLRRASGALQLSRRP